MLTNNYIELVVNSTHASSGNCVSILMGMLHGYMRHNGVNFGVSFPAMDKKRLGDKVRAFGTVDVLTAVLSNEQIQDACKRSIFSLSVYAPTAIPENAKPICYVKNNKAPGLIDSIARRAVRRYNRRHTAPMPLNDQKELKRKLSINACDSPYFTIKNETCVYTIYVKKGDLIENSENVFNSYGLGNQGGTVYSF